MKRIVVIAPHPDDDIIGCGGSIMKHLKKGNQVFIIYITFGAVETEKLEVPEFIGIRKRETLAAAAVMGVPENNLSFLWEQPWIINDAKTRFKLLEILRKIKPDLCYLPTADEHIDHQLVNKIAKDVIAIAPGRWWRKYGSNCGSVPVATILEYEVAKPISDPNYFEDITNHYDKKTEALEKHETQNLAKYKQTTEALGNLRGRSGRKAEAFKIISLQKGLI